jgi:EAL domain-containing protein (putative c-di-GMP-specific phosphodiesterase class I)
MAWGDGFLSAARADGDVDSTVQWAIEAVRSHLGMEVAYVSEFVGNDSVYRYVDAPGLEHLIKPGDSRPLDEVYCPHIVAGRLPELIPDTSREELAMSMPITHAVPIGAHVSVPLRLDSGEPFGMFCCLSPHADGSLNERDLQAFRLFAEIAAHQIRREVNAEQATREKRQRIEQVLADGAFHPVYQPIRDFVNGTTMGFEALSRFAGKEPPTPDQWFADAFAAGLGPQLEVAAVRAALADAHHLPPQVYLSVNVSPTTILDNGFGALLCEAAHERRVVLEITEHAAVQDYVALETALRPLRAQGVALAIDDAGAGFSSLQHIVQLRPDIIKLDMSLIRAIDREAPRRALASALVYFAADTGAAIVAEGIETNAERATLQGLGISLGQGYLFGRPQAAPAGQCGQRRGSQYR